jgi:hypothetical protein
VDVQLFSPFDLYEAAAYMMLGEEERAKRILRKVNPMDFYFLSRHYHNTIFLKVEAILFPMKVKANDLQVNDLTQRTGFWKLANLFEREEFVNKKEQRGNLRL